MKKKIAAMIVALLSIAILPVATQATSLNKVDNKVNVGVKEAVSPKDPVCLKIYPNDTVTPDSSIIITAKNGRFDEDAWNKSGGSNFYYGEGGKFSDSPSYYNSLMDEFSATEGSTEDLTAILKKALGSKTNCLPFRSTIINKTQMQVDLFPVDKKYTKITLSEICSRGVVCYNIPLPLMDYDEGSISISIDNNGTTISNGNFVIANADLEYNEEKNVQTKTTVNKTIKAFNKVSESFDLELSEVKRGSLNYQTGNGKITLELNDGYVFNDKVSIEPGYDNTSANKDFMPYYVYPKKTNNSVIEFRIPDVFRGSPGKLCSIKICGVVLKADGTQEANPILYVYGDSVSFERVELLDNAEIVATTQTVKTTETTTEVTTLSDETTKITTKSESSTNEPTDNELQSKSIAVTIGSSIATINGTEKYDMYAAPYIQQNSNSTMVPLRFVSLGINGDDVENSDSSGSVSWDEDTKTATIITADKVISFTAGSDVVYINNRAMIMEHGVKAEITNNRMYVPFRALGSALGVNVEWNDETKTAVYK
jgi:hypothetical protein